MNNFDAKTPLPCNADIEREIGGLIISGFEGKKLSRELKKELRDGLGGVILFPRNLGDVRSILKLTQSLRDAGSTEGLIVSIDHEGGRVIRLGKQFTQFPPFAAIGRAGDVELARKTGRAVGSELAAVGINFNFSPVVDLCEPDSKSVIGDRSLGTDPGLVAQLAAAYVDGMQSEGVAACAKHFPGHGAVTGDSHEELPQVDLSREQMEPHLAPFRHMAESGVASIMTAHIRVRGIDPYHPATLSSAALRCILRDEMGYEGVIVTDDLQMAAVADTVGVLDAAFMSIRAGANMLLVAHDIEMGRAVRKQIDLAVRHMAISFEDITDSVERVKIMKNRYPAFSKSPPPLDVVGCAEHRDLARRLGEFS